MRPDSLTSTLEEVARVLKPGGIYFLEELYPSLYQNFITRRILVHPTRDRFRSRDLRESLEKTGMPLQDSLEIKWVGLLGIARKA